MIPNKTITLDYVESTNITTSQLAKSKVIENGDVIFAHSQTKGKGQINNYWESEPKKNFTFSIFLEPNFLPIHKQFYISKAISIAIFSFVKEYAENVKIKWPNDIYINDKKIAGILIENTIMGANLSSSIVGVGININQTEFLEQTPNPVSLKLINSLEYNLKELQTELLSKIDYWHKMLTMRDFSKINDFYLDNLYKYNQWHKFRIKDKEFRAKIIDILESGELVIVNKDNKQSTYYFKEIEFVIDKN